MTLCKYHGRFKHLKLRNKLALCLKSLTNTAIVFHFKSLLCHLQTYSKVYRVSRLVNGFLM